MKQIGAVFIALGSLANSANLSAQEEESPFPEEARERLDYAIGKWQSRSQYMDEDGKILRTVYSDDERRYVIDDRVVEINVVQEDGRTFRAWEYYGVRDKKYTLTSIDRDGSLVTMKGDLGGKFVWTSATRELPNGGSSTIRYTHTDIEGDSFTAIGEISRDGGETWREFSRQYLTRSP